MTDASNSLLELSVDIVSSYVSNNRLQPTELADLIKTVHGALSGIGDGTQQEPAEELKPPVSIKKSITPDFLISMEDGKRYKSLKRHLNGRGLTPEQYREKWGLPKDYPMVSPNYSASRSQLAKALGLGQLRRKVEDAPAKPKRAKKAA